MLKTPKFAALYANENIRSKINEINAFGTKGVLSGWLSAIANYYLSRNYRIIHTLEMMVLLSAIFGEEYDGFTPRSAYNLQEIVLYTICGYK